MKPIGKVAWLILSAFLIYDLFFLQTVDSRYSTYTGCGAGQEITREVDFSQIINKASLISIDTRIDTFALSDDPLSSIVQSENCTEEYTVIRSVEKWRRNCWKCNDGNWGCRELVKIETRKIKEICFGQVFKETERKIPIHIRCAAAWLNKTSMNPQLWLY